MADHRPDGWEEKQQPDGVGHEAGGEHQGAGQQHEQAVHQLLSGHASLGQLTLGPTQDAQPLPPDQPGADHADQDQQADRVEHPGRAGHTHDHRQLHDRRHQEDQEEEEEHLRMLRRERVRLASPG